MCINDSGQTVVIWKRQKESNYDIRVSTLTFGGSWSSGTSLTSLGAGVNSPWIHINASGQTVAVWIHTDGSNLLVESATITFGGSWSTTDVLSATGMDASDPRVAINDSGQVAVLWIRNDVIQSCTSTFGGAWSAVNDLSIKPSVSTPIILLDASGNIRASWRRTSGTFRIYEIGTAVFGGSWKSPIFLSQNEKSLDYINFDISENGKAVVSWYYDNGSDTVVKGVTCDCGIWGDVSTLSDSGQDALDAEAVVNNAGYVVVIWRRFNDSNQIIQAATQSI